LTEPAATALDWAIAALLVTGAAFALVGSLGLAKLGDFYRRLHGPTKATTLGVGAILCASSLFFSALQHAPSLHELLVALFLFVTAPVSAQLLVKSSLADDADAPRPPDTPDTADAADAADDDRTGDAGTGRPATRRPRDRA
jgi:multicomponent K+:H+ antiporter subunit G